MSNFVWGGRGWGWRGWFLVIFINIFLKTWWWFLVPFNPIKRMRLYFQENIQEAFVMLVVVIFPHWRFFTSELLFYATNTQPWFLRPIKVSTSSKLYSDCFQLHTFASFSVSCLSHFTASATILMFFTHKRFIPRTPSPHFGAFLTWINPLRIFLHACSPRVVPSG